MTLIYIIISTFLISLLSMVGLIFMFANRKFVHKIVMLLISLSAGTLMGGTFLHLLPEASETMESDQLFMIVLFSFIFFYIVERVLHWRHCHHDDCKVHSFGYMNLIGDGIHNFMDGMIIASAFVTDIRLGIITSVAIAMHELPQEIGDFGVLIKAGFSKKRAFFFNFLTSLTALVGALLAYSLSGRVDNLASYMLPIAAGGFIYIAASDLLPEIRKEENMPKAILSFIVFMIGIILMYGLTYLE
jgi:zinc and cadmium transporter